MTERQQTKAVKCLLCRDMALHNLRYYRHNEDTIWEGDYCTKCLAAKLRGMASVFGKRITTSKEDCWID